jgi:hypothetical protein
MVCLWVGFLLALPQSSQGIVVDWATFDWTDEALSQSYDPDASNAGDDITVSIGGNTDRLNNNFPRDDTSLRGGLGAGTQSMHMKVNFENNTQEIVVTITFNYNNWLADGAYGVSLQLFDIDQENGYIDEIRNISGSFNGGPSIGPTSVTGSVDNTVTGSGASAVVTGTGNAGDSSGQGNVTIDFGTNVLTQIQFTIGNNSAAKANPGAQDFALYSLTYTKHAIPEVHPGMVAVVVCFAVVLLRRLQVRRQSLSKTRPD